MANEGMKYKNEKEEGDITIPNGQNSVTYTFSESYNVAPRVIVDKLNNSLQDITATTTSATFTATDTAGRTAHISVISCDH